MNFKKIISGVSALAIAAGAFAAMAVTASAFTKEVDYIGTSSAAETFDGFDFTGTAGVWEKQDANNKVDSGLTYAKVGKASDYTRTNNEKYADLDALLAKYTSAATAEEVEASLSSNQTLTANEDGSYVVSTAYEALRISGNVLTTQKRGRGSVATTFTANEAVSSGKIVFETDIATAGNAYGKAYRGGYVQLNDAEGNAIFKVAFPAPGSNGDYGKTTLTSNGGYSANTNNTNVGYGANRGEKLSITIDLDNNTVKGTYSYNQTTQGKANTVNIDTAIAEGTTFKGLTVSTTSSSSESNLIALDNTKLYSEKNVTAELDSVTGVQEFTKGSDTEKPVTAAVLNVTVTNGPAKVKVTYDGTDKETETSFSGSAVIGVVVNGIGLDLGTGSFTVTAVE